MTITLNYFHIFAVFALIYTFKFFMINDLRGYPILFAYVAYIVGLVIPAVVALAWFMIYWLVTLVI